MLELEILVTGKRLEYKVPLKILDTMNLDSSDLTNLERGKDYYRVHVTVKSLQYHQLLMNIKKFSVSVNYLHARNFGIESQHSLSYSQPR
jgi:hypothetical protein